MFFINREDRGIWLEKMRAQRYSIDKALLMRIIIHVNEADQMFPIFQGF